MLSGGLGSERLGILQLLIALWTLLVDTPYEPGASSFVSSWEEVEWPVAGCPTHGASVTSALCSTLALSGYKVGVGPDSDEERS